MINNKIVVSTLALSICLGGVGYCAKPNDMRVLIGLPIIGSEFTQEETQKIKKEYEEIQRHNNLVQIVIDSNGDRAVLDEQINKETKELQQSITKANEELVNAFNRESVKVVKEKSSFLSNLQSQLENIKKEGSNIDIELKDNPYVEDYKKIQLSEELLVKEKDIGTVGNILKSPLGTKLDILEPYGVYKINETESIDSKSVKLKGIDGINVYSLWGGTVKSINSVGAINEVIIQHSDYMLSKYTNLKDIKVQQGQEINQYTTLGKLCGTFLDLSISMDNVPTNPMYFFGQNGVNAVKEYTTKSGNNVNMNDYLNVKDGVDEEDETEKPIYNKTGEVEEGAIEPTLNGKAPKPSNTLTKEDLEDDITSREKSKGNSIKESR